MTKEIQQTVDSIQRSVGSVSESMKNDFLKKILPQFRIVKIVALVFAVIFLAVMTPFVLTSDVPRTAGVAFTFAFVELIILAIYLSIRKKVTKIRQSDLKIMEASGTLTFKLGMPAGPRSPVPSFGSRSASYLLYLNGLLLPAAIDGFQMKKTQTYIDQNHIDISNVTVQYIPELSVNLSLSNKNGVFFDFTETNPLT